MNPKMPNNNKNHDLTSETTINRDRINHNEINEIDLNQTMDRSFNPGLDTSGKTMVHWDNENARLNTDKFFTEEQILALYDKYKNLLQQDESFLRKGNEI
jgi:hypothetical protein